ncbi:MAG: hypothetical protein WA474_00290 [Candidatus Sulfotelmatobacter sp.]
MNHFETEPYADRGADPVGIEKSGVVVPNRKNYAEANELRDDVGEKIFEMPVLSPAEHCHGDTRYQNGLRNPESVIDCFELIAHGNNNTPDLYNKRMKRNELRSSGTLNRLKENKPFNAGVQCTQVT